MRKPSNNPISLRFGSTEYPYSPSSPHTGVDFIPGNDPTVYAPFTGQVILRPNNGKDGNGVYMYNGDQFHGMLHNDHYLVSDGDLVQEGQPIAIMGWTGYVVPASKDGTHLHWCVKVNGSFIDPLTLVDEQELDMQEIPKPSEEDVKGHFQRYLDKVPEPSEIAFYTAHDWGTLNGFCLQYMNDIIVRDLRDQVAWYKENQSQNFKPYDGPQTFLQVKQ